MPRFGSKVALFLLLSAWPWPGGALNAVAATFYVDPAASDDAGSGSPASPKKYVTSGIQLMKSGDTLILRDGVYLGARNLVGDDASPKVYPPSGRAGRPTTIRAEHVGEAIIDGGYRARAFSSVDKSGETTDHLVVTGIHFRHGGDGVFNIKGHYNKVTDCGFEDGMAPSASTETPIAFIAGGSSYSLVEDCWVWGKGRYGMYTSSPAGGTHHIVFRRVVVRLDDTPDRVMTAGIRFYNAAYNTCENCIVVDCTQPSASSPEGPPAAFATGGGSSLSEPGHAFLGVIALHNPTMHGLVPENGAQTITVSDSVFWGGTSGLFVNKRYLPGFVLDARHLTIGGYGRSGKDTGYGVRSNPNYQALTVKLSDSLVEVPDGTQAFQGPSQLTNTFVYIPGSGMLGSAGSGPRGTLSTALYRAGLKHLPRVERSSLLQVARVGATVVNRIGAQGTLSGEPGWDSPTREPLWPFPHEKLWTAKMKAYTASGPGGNRGFAAVQSATPLTDYIWGYLGTPLPSGTVPGR